MTYFVVNDECNGCLACVENCPAGALDTETSNNSITLLHNMAKCARCATCWRICPQNAIEFQHLIDNRWDKVATIDFATCEICGESVLAQKLKASLPSVSENKAMDLCAYHRALQAARNRVAPFFKKSSDGRNKTNDRR